MYEQLHTMSHPWRAKAVLSDSDQINVLPFEECIIDKLHRVEDGNLCSVCVSFNYEKDSGFLILQRNEKDAVKFVHPSNCPFHYLSADEVLQIAANTLERGVDIGVAALLQSCDGFVMITRRAAHMRTFPGIWVPPGGHVEKGEDLVTAVLRELKEETGISLNQAEIKERILGLYESGFPPFKSWGLPKRHHIVVYFLIKSSLNRSELQQQIVLDSDEVDAFAWLNNLAIEAVLGDKEDSIEKVEMYNLDCGSLVKSQMSSNIFTRTVSDEDDKDVERISTGTLVALRMFLDEASST